MNVRDTLIGVALVASGVGLVFIIADTVSTAEDNRRDIEAVCEFTEGVFDVVEPIVPPDIYIQLTELLEDACG